MRYLVEGTYAVELARDGFRGKLQFMLDRMSGINNPIFRAIYGFVLSTQGLQRFHNTRPIQLRHSVDSVVRYAFSEGSTAICDICRSLLAIIPGTIDLAAQQLFGTAGIEQVTYAVTNLIFEDDWLRNYRGRWSILPPLSLHLRESLGTHGT